MTLEDALSDFELRTVPAVLIIPEEFSIDALKKGETTLEFKQQPNDLDAIIIEQAVQTAADRISSRVEIANKSVAEAEALNPFGTELDKQAHFDAAYIAAKDILAEAPQRIRTEEGKTEDTIDYDPSANSTAGQMITWVFIPLIGLSATFALEREGGTLRRLLVSPTSKALYISATVLGQVLAAAVQMMLLILFGSIVMNVDWGGSPLALGMVVFSSCLAAAALGTMLGTFIKTSGQAEGLSLMLGMAMALLGGCWYPIELFPAFMRSAAKVLPTTWAMQGFVDLTVRGQGLSGVWQESLILLGFAGVFFIIGVLRFRYE